MVKQKDQEHTKPAGSVLFFRQYISHTKYREKQRFPCHSQIHGTDIFRRNREAIVAEGRRIWVREAKE